jgi:dihydroorotase-like cyclic amidohydrolase
MLSDRRPILLANARIVDPSRDMDFPGDLLIADGIIREAKKGIGAAGVPEGTEVVDCRGKVVAPGLIDIRAFIGEPGAGHRETFASASQAAAAGGVTTIVCQPNTSPVIDDPATVDFVLRRARHRDRARTSDGGADQRAGRQGDDRNRPAESSRRGRLHRRRQERHQRAGDAARAHLRQ